MPNEEIGRPGVDRLTGAEDRRQTHLRNPPGNGAPAAKGGKSLAFIVVRELPSRHVVERAVVGDLHPRMPGGDVLLEAEERVAQGVGLRRGVEPYATVP